MKPSQFLSILPCLALSRLIALPIHFHSPILVNVIYWITQNCHGLLGKSEKMLSYKRKMDGKKGLIRFSNAFAMEKNLRNLEN